MSSRAEVMDKVRGVYRFSSLVTQNKKAKIYFVIYIAGFMFLKKNSVMKCLRSKKRPKRPVTTTMLGWGGGCFGATDRSAGRRERAYMRSMFMGLVTKPIAVAHS